MATLSVKVWHGYGALLLNTEPQDQSKAGTSQPTCTESKQRYLKKVHFIKDNFKVGGFPAVVAQWQRTGSSSQRCPGFDFQQLSNFAT